MKRFAILKDNQNPIAEFDTTQQVYDHLRAQPLKPYVSGKRCLDMVVDRVDNCSVSTNMFCDAFFLDDPKDIRTIINQFIDTRQLKSSLIGIIHLN